MESIVFLNGFFVALKNARVSILDRGFCYGDGLFETMRSYKGKVFRLDLHLERLFSSAPLIYLDLPVTCHEMSAIVRETLRRNNCADAIIRLTVTRGESIPGLRIDPTAPPTLVVFVRPIAPLSEQLYRDGVTITFFPSSACRISGITRQVKSGNYLSQILLRKAAESGSFLEAILLDDEGRVTEGTTTNIFTIHNGVLRTPPLSEYVLPGITRHIVLEIARGKSIPCREENITQQDIYAADEVFLTNTGVEVLPVRQAGDIVIGQGKPGKLTRLLHREFLNTVEQQP